MVSISRLNTANCVSMALSSKKYMQALLRTVTELVYQSLALGAETAAANVLDSIGIPQLIARATRRGASR